MTLNEAQQQRDAGIQQAVDHADHVVPHWSMDAYALLMEFLVQQGYKPFTSEQVREYATARGLPQPAHLRAWGGPMAKAARNGLIRRAGIATAKAPHVHCSILNQWVRA